MTRRGVRECKSAIYTAPLAAGQRPRAVNAIVLGHAIFNDLRGAKSSLDSPRRLVAFYTYKSPLTVWGSTAVTVTVIRPRRTARLLYDSRDLQRLGTQIMRVASLHLSATFEICRGSNGGLATQYNGGFALLRPECVTLAVKSADVVSTTRVVPFGVKHC